MTMRSALPAIGLLCVLVQLASADDRLVHVQKLVSEYDAAAKAYYEAPQPQELMIAEQIRSYEAWPGWQYLPRFMEVLQTQPDDEAAYQSCQWIVDRMRNVGNAEKPMFEADEAAWKILAEHHTHREDLPMMCLRAVQYFGPAREAFLRELLARDNLPSEQRGFATIALAELLAHKYDFLEVAGADSRRQPRDEFAAYVKQRMHPDWGKDLIPANAAKFKSESIALFREVLDEYANIPVTITAPYFRDLKNLGEKASKSLHALENLTLGAEAPNIVGKDLHGQPMELRDFRGKVAVLSFWFTGCGPCMEMIPQEQKLVETYEGQPFVLLGICSDESPEQAQKTASEYKMTWPCWFDGQDGPIAQDWNVLGWPTIYVLDKNGIIAAKNAHGDDLDLKIAQIMKVDEKAEQ
jgi:thiol-disulfide isomerase/thioredoxin